LEKFIHGCKFGIIWLYQMYFDKVSDNVKFIMACKYGYSFILVQLLDKGFDPTSNNNIGIELAYQNNDIKIVRILLKDERVKNKLKDSELEKYTILSKKIIPR